MCSMREPSGTSGGSAEVPEQTAGPADAWTPGDGSRLSSGPARCTTPVSGPDVPGGHPRPAITIAGDPSAPVTTRWPSMSRKKRRPGGHVGSGVRRLTDVSLEPGQPGSPAPGAGCIGPTGQGLRRRRGLTAGGTHLGAAGLAGEPAAEPPQAWLAGVAPGD